VDNTHSCTGTTIFFSQVRQIATIRFPLTRPSVLTVRSLPVLLVARRASQAELQNSVKRGRNAVSMVDGRQISKKLVRTIGCSFSAILTLAPTVKTVSLPQLSQSSRSNSMT